MSVLIRNAKPGDEQGIVYATMRGWQTTYNEIMPIDYLAGLDRELPSRIERWTGRLQDKEFCSRTFVALQKDQLIGYATGGKNRSKDYPHESEIYAMYVLKPHQRLGVGLKLVSAMVNQFVDQKSNSLLISTLEKNFIGRRFYESLGGKVIGARMFEVQGEHYPEIIFGWEGLEEIAQVLASRAASR